MAIDSLYPSRRQSRWSNPLFVRAQMRKLRYGLSIVLALAVLATGLWVLADGFHPQTAPVAQRVLKTSQV